MGRPLCGHIGSFPARPFSWRNFRVADHPETIPPKPLSLPPAALRLVVVNQLCTCNQRKKDYQEHRPRISHHIPSFAFTSAARSRATCSSVRPSFSFTSSLPPNQVWISFTASTFSSVER